MNTRLLFLVIVLIAVVGSALGVVQSRHQARRLSVQLGQLESARDAAIAEWSRLQLEQAYLADAGQVEAKARKELAMAPPEKANILVIRR